MLDIEKKCRQIAKQKEILIRKGEQCITVHFTVTIRRQSKNFHSWEEVLQFVENF